MRSIFIMTIPSIINLGLDEAENQINMRYAGHLGDPAMLAGMGLAASLKIMLPYSMMIGVASVLETMVS